MKFDTFQFCASFYSSKVFSETSEIRCISTNRYWLFHLFWEFSMYFCF